ncbi:MAG: V-type ATPase subunit, partial [Candidatus Nanohaloarchaea archaeon]
RSCSSKMTDYPYMYARVSAKRAKLLDTSDYENLVKMQPNEIARNLGEGEYRQEIDELGARYDGVELVELALTKNLSRTLSHLSTISPPELEEVMNVYLRRYDLISIKRLLRWKKSDRSIDIEDLMVPAGSIDRETLEELKQMEFDEIVGSVSFSDSLVSYGSYIEGEQELREIENSLDKAYYEELHELSDRIESQHFSRFIRKELEFENLRTVLRLKKYGRGYDDIEPYLVARNGSGLVEEAGRAEDLDEALDIVRREKEVEGDRLEDIEQALEVQRLEEALTMLHAEPLGITSILGYVVAKIIEVKNLRMLIRAKETGIQNLETIRKNLVMA